VHKKFFHLHEADGPSAGRSRRGLRAWLVNRLRALRDMLVPEGPDWWDMSPETLATVSTVKDAAPDCEAPERNAGWAELPPGDHVADATTPKTLGPVPPEDRRTTHRAHEPMDSEDDQPTTECGR
jgi:hypothetical protein